MSATLTSTCIASELALAFQPMIDLRSGHSFAWQAVVTDRAGRSFDALVGARPLDQRPDLDMQRTEWVITQAVAAGLLDNTTMLAVPLRSAMDDQAVAHLFCTALAHGVPASRLIVEINADERGHLDPALATISACQARGIAVLLDGFSAGPLGMRLLARGPQFLRLDRTLVRAVDGSGSRRQIVESVLRLAHGFGTTVIAADLHSGAELATLSGLGVQHVQGEWLEPVRPRAVPHVLRREPRSGFGTVARPVAPQHRRLSHHQRAMAQPTGTLPGSSRIAIA